MAGVRGEVPNLTVADLLKRYSEQESEKKKGRKWEQVRLRAVAASPLGSVRLRDLSSPHVARWQQERLQAVSEASVRRERNLLNAAFEIARKEWGWLTVNPFTNVRRPADGKPRNRLATQDELNALTTAASHTLRRVIIFAVETGMRASEIAALERVEGRVAYLLDTKNGTSREVPLSEKALSVWQGGFKITAGSISGLFAKLCAKCKIEGLTFHDLRHFACVQLARKLTLLELCKVMGWKDPRHAMIYYSERTETIAAKL